MPQWFQKPENALKRAKELLEVEKKEDALDTLHDVIKSRRHRNWTKTHEEIMFLHLDLCVQIKKPLAAKDALWQYRNIVQSINVKSLEDVVTHYLGLAERKAEEARVKAQELVEKGLASPEEDTPDDLDMADDPESLLLSAVTGADAQDRADRTLLSPWLRFMWESYRQCLELLRNNAQVEHLYHKIAKKALDFCKKYQRRAEFRKLCDNLRNHLTQLQKTQNQSYSVKLSNPDTIQAMQETRLYQLEIAIQMELWQEAYKSGEDVHGLVMMSAEKKLRPQAVANYYEKLAIVFWKAGNRLFHAAALVKLFNWSKDMKKNFGGEDAANLASRAVLATLAIPGGAAGPSQLAKYLDVEELSAMNTRKLAALLELPRVPTRSSLLKDLIRYNVIKLASAPVKELYRILEIKFSPLKLAELLNAEVEKVESIADLEIYLEAVKEIGAIRILQQISEMYETISLERLSKMIPFVNPIMLERLAVLATKKSQIQIRIDHRGGSFEFCRPEGMTTSRSGDDDEINSADADAGIQDLAGKEIRGQVENLYVALQAASNLIRKQDIKDAQMKTLKTVAQTYLYHAKEDVTRIYNRKVRIEKYKELSERRRQHLEEEEKMKRQKEDEERRRDEKKRLEKEEQAYKEDVERARSAELKKKIVSDKIDKLQKSKIGQKIIEGMDENELDNMEIEELLQKQVLQMEKDLAEQQKVLSNQERRWDHLIRALHLEEIPYRQADYKKEAPLRKQYWETYEETRVAKEFSDHDHAVKTFERLTRLQDDAADFIKSVRDSRKQSLIERKDQWEKKKKAERAKRLEERKNQRKAQRRSVWLKDEEDKKIAREKKEEEMAMKMRSRSQREERAPRPVEEPSLADTSSNWRSGMSSRTEMPSKPDRGGGPPNRSEDAGNWRGGPRGGGGAEEDGGRMRNVGMDRGSEPRGEISRENFGSHMQPERRDRREPQAELDWGKRVELPQSHQPAAPPVSEHPPHPSDQGGSWRRPDPVPHPARQIERPAGGGGGTYELPSRRGGDEGYRGRDDRSGGDRGGNFGGADERREIGEWRRGGPPAEPARGGDDRYESRGGRGDDERFERRRPPPADDYPRRTDDEGGYRRGGGDYDRRPAAQPAQRGGGDNDERDWRSSTQPISSRDDEGGDRRAGGGGRYQDYPPTREEGGWRDRVSDRGGYDRPSGGGGGGAYRPPMERGGGGGGDRFGDRGADDRGYGGDRGGGERGGGSRYIERDEPSDWRRAPAPEGGSAGGGGMDDSEGGGWTVKEAPSRRRLPPPTSQSGGPRGVVDRGPPAGRRDFGDRREGDRSEGGGSWRRGGGGGDRRDDRRGGDGGGQQGGAPEGLWR